METFIPIISVIILLGFLANRLNKKDNLARWQHTLE